MTSLLREACKKFGNKESFKIAKIFNKNGVQLFQDDLMLLNPGDVLYLAMKGTHQTNASDSNDIL